MNGAGKPSPSIDEAEVGKFSGLAGEWWKPGGKYAVLHAFNPARVRHIRQLAAQHFGQDAPDEDRPLAGLRILDIGCGGGLLSEALAALGAKMTSIDPSEENIRAARAHAGSGEPGIDYRVSTAEELAGTDAAFDIVLNMEVLEHVRGPKDFLAVCAGLVRPGGMMICATINRTLKSFMLAIAGAEYILRWLPRGTHHWENFITPDEMKDWLRKAGLIPVDETGVVYSLMRDEWRLSRDDMSVNYMLAAKKPEAGPPAAS